MTPSRSHRTSQGRGSARALLGVVAAGMAVLALAGCGAGQIGTIGSQVPAVNGSEATAGPVALRDVRIQYPAGASSYSAGQSAPLLFTAANSGVEADELVSISTPAAAEVRTQGATALPGGASLVSAPRAETATATTSATASPTATTSAPASAAAGAVTPGQVQAELVNLTQDLKPGLTVPVTFTFAKAGAITMPVPIGSPESARE